MTIIDYFDRTSIINLPERSDRRSETIDEFKRIGRPIKNEKVNFFPAIRPDTPDGFPSLGAKGCLLSHMSAIKKARQDNLANILIMEDDIAFISDINIVAAEALQELEGTDWGFLYLGHEYPLKKTSGRRLELLTEPLPLTHFYAINGTIFDRFLGFLDQVLIRPPGHPDGGPMHYDGAISTFRMQNRDINTFLIVPSLAYQRSSRTDLLPPSLWDRWTFLSPLVNQMRKLKNALKRSRV